MNKGTLKIKESEELIKDIEKLFDKNICYSGHGDELAGKEQFLSMVKLELDKLMMIE